MAQTKLNDTIKVTLEKAEALEKHVKTVTMRAESLATTDGDFFKTPVNRQEEAHNHMNSLSAQLSTVAPSSQSRTRRRLKQHSASVHTIQLKVVHLFVKSSSSLCDFLSQRGSFGKGAGAAAVGGTVAPHVRSRNFAVRATAQAWNDASNCGPDFEPPFFLMKRASQT